MLLSRTRPTGSGSAAISRRPAAAARIRSGVKRSRSICAALRPCSEAAATSRALAARMSAARPSISWADSTSQRFLRSPCTVLSRRAAARARRPRSSQYVDRSMFCLALGSWLLALGSWLGNKQPRAKSKELTLLYFPVHLESVRHDHHVSGFADIVDADDLGGFVGHGMADDGERASQTLIHRTVEQLAEQSLPRHAQA